MTDSKENFCLGEIYFKALHLYKERNLMYIADTDEVVTYNEFLSLCVRMALKLKKKGFKRTDIISTCTYNQKYGMVPIIAAQFLGLVTANFDPRISRTETIHLLKLIEPRTLFVVEQSSGFMEECVKEAGLEVDIVVFESDRFFEYLRADEDESTFYPEIVDENDTALIAFSSGTTGLPKGICLSHRSFKIDAQVLHKINPNPVKSLLFASNYWISAHINFSRSVTNGNGTVVCKEFEPKSVWKIIEKYKVFSMFLPPYLARELLKVKPERCDVSSVRYIATGSCPLTLETMLDLREAFPQGQVFNVYSQTEFGGTIICFFHPAFEYEEQVKKPMSSGKFRDSFGIQWKIADLDSEKPLGPFERGELRIKSDSLMKGYYKMDSSHVYDSEGYLKTGDIAYYDEDKCIYILDRVKEMFKCKGFHVIPAVIENVLKSHPAVKDAVVVGTPHGEEGFHPMGIVQLNDERGSIDEADLVNYVNERVADYQKLRAGIKFVSCIPKTVTAKTKTSDLLQAINH
ncbi:unnamed protein product [Phyllotreta striolata]|uniref:Uncharacterized protein n=1 Tax=Phyllotreta striolata TaxID=444603 RepID=A0A9N9TI13_PHYSR|nr:unnamed protein product [Phyllotreta striolata]